MLDDEVKSRLQDLLADATDEENTGKRAELLKRYLAEPYGDEIKGKSQFVDASVSDAVEAILPEVMDIFTGSEHLVEFAPVGPEDESAAKQETAAVRHIFWQKNPGFEVLYTWIKEAMIQQNSYCWQGWVEKDEVEIEEYEGLDYQEYLMVMSQIEGDYEVQEQSGFEIVVDEESGAEVPVMEMGEDGQPVGIDLRIRCVKNTKQYVIEPFPQEDFFITPRWSALDLDGVPLCGRIHRNKTKEDWIAYGFSEESIEAFTRSADDEEEKAARHHTNDLDESQTATDYVEVYEIYAMIDADGDGIAELVQIWANEDASHILEWENGDEAVEEYSRVPITAMTPYIMPHRHIGRSVAENVDDIAKVKSVLMRTTLDALYASLYKRPHYNEIEAGENLEQDLASPDHGASVRTGGAEVTYPQTGAEAVPSATLPLMEKFDALQEIRTGATRYNQGLDADTLNKTMGGMAMIMGASQKKAKLIARTFAETALMRMFRGIHADLRKGPMKELVFQLRGQWVAVNPRAWKSRADMVVNVGMGRGDREERRAALGMTAQTQEKLIAAGSRMVDESKLFNTIADTLETFGVMGPENYFYDPNKLPPPPPPPPPAPDPIMISAQSQAQKMQADAQRDAAKLQADEREKERRFQLEMQRLRLEELKLTNTIQNERETLDLKEKEAVMKDDLERDKLDVTGAPGIPYGQVTGDTR